MTKGITIVGISIAVVIAIVIGSALTWNYFQDYSTTLNANWEIQLPRKAHYSEVYRKDSGATFHGDGIRYHVFSYQEEKQISRMLDWSDHEEKMIFHSSYSEAITEWLNSIDVPSGEWPNDSECLSWYESQADNSEIIVLWDAGLKRIYVVESFL